MSISAAQIEAQLYELADEKYKVFHSKLLPGVDDIIGVRVPELRKIAKTIAKDDWKVYFKDAQGRSYEERMLRGFVIGYAKMTPEERFEYLDLFVPTIDNWAVCDCVCSSLKFTKKYEKEVWTYIQKYFQSERPYELRFAIVMILDYFTSDEYLEDVFRFFDSVTCTHYYVEMALAWAVSVLYVHAGERTEQYLKHNQLNDWTHHKAIQKICESYRVDSDDKKRLRALKRK